MNDETGGEREVSIGKILSLLIAITYGVIVVMALAANARPTAEIVVKSCEALAVLLVPLALIWFPEQIGAATGYIGHGVASESPPILVSFMGWVILLGLPVAAYFLR